jgi:hypothetical protein
LDCTFTIGRTCSPCVGALLVQATQHASADDLIRIDNEEITNVRPAAESWWLSVERLIDFVF